MPIDALSPSLLIQRVIMLILVLAIIGVSFWIVLPFFGAAMWGGVIAVSIFPIHQRLASALGSSPRMSATLIGFVLIATLLVPLALLVPTVGEYATRLIKMAPEVEGFPVAPAWIPEIPIAGRRLAAMWNEAASDLTSTLESLRPQLRTGLLWLLSRLMGSTVTLLEALLAIVFAAVFLVTGKSLGHFFARILANLNVSDAEGLLALIAATVRSVFQGIIGTAFIQAAIAWAGYAVAGAPFPLLLAFLVFVLCTIQLGAVFLGAAVGAWMWFGGESGWAIFVVLWSIFVSVVDNFIKPLLIGRGLSVPLWIILIGVIGGLIAMGLIGLFIGPVILSVAYILLQAWVVDGEASARAAPRI